MEMIAIIETPGFFKEKKNFWRGLSKDIELADVLVLGTI